MTERGATEERAHSLDAVLERRDAALRIMGIGWEAIVDDAEQKEDCVEQKVDLVPLRRSPVNLFYRTFQNRVLIQNVKSKYSMKEK